MSVEHSNGIKEIKINDSESIIIESKWQEVYEWNEVSYKIGEDVIFIGSYYTYDCGISRGWMEYNEETIALLTKYIPSYLEIEDEDCEYDDSIHIDVLFDIKTRLLIDGSKEDLLAYYNQQFGNENQREGSVNFQRKLFIRRK